MTVHVCIAELYCNHIIVSQNSISQITYFTRNTDYEGKYIIRVVTCSVHVLTAAPFNLRSVLPVMKVENRIFLAENILSIDSKELMIVWSLDSVSFVMSKPLVLSVGCLWPEMPSIIVTQ